jgi:hypothetical protein
MVARKQATSTDAQDQPLNAVAAGDWTAEEGDSFLPYRIFLSHKHEDKPIVEPIALRLREMLGEGAVFYDAWSISPGDGIIEKMDQGLLAPEFVFFFVSRRSLDSGLVKIEWQNSLLKASKGQTRLVPVKIDNVSMPEVLRQTLYVDIYSVGLEVGLNQIVNVVQGNSSFTPRHLGFSNLTWSTEQAGDGAVLLTIHASHLMEPNPNFVVMLDSKQSEVSFELNGGGPMLQGFYESPFGPNRGNGFTIAPMGGAITPERPMKVKLTPTKPSTQLNIAELLHGWSDPIRPVPRKT